MSDSGDIWDLKPEKICDIRIYLCNFSTNFNIVKRTAYVHHLFFDTKTNSNLHLFIVHFKTKLFCRPLIF